MIDRKRLIAVATGVLASGLALATAAMTVPAGLASSDGEPVRMSGLKVEGLSGYAVLDSFGQTVGQVIDVEADHKGRTRYVRIALDAGGEARISAFRASLDADARRIDLHLPRDLVAPG